MSVSMKIPPETHRIGLALGSGSVRGMAHIGVIERLLQLNIQPQVVCGTSVGAMVGAAFAAGKLKELRHWVSNLNNKKVVRYMDISLLASGGFAEGKELIRFFEQEFGDLRIEELPIQFAAIATDLNTGREIWLREGSLWEAVRASIALPGIMTPTKANGYWLVDGGLVNPVPVSVCRALGADQVIAVNLNGDLVSRSTVVRTAKGKLNEHEVEETLLGKIKGTLTGFLPEKENDAPGLFEVIASTINIMQDRITRSRLAGEPPDIMLAPRLAGVGLLEFARITDAIAEGEACVDRMVTAIHHALEINESNSSPEV